jgi:glucose/arabinose dehydrogenase
VVALVGCSDEPVPAPQSTSDSPSVSPSETTRAEPAPESFDPAEANLDTRVVAAGFEAPTGLAHAGDGSGRLFVIEQGGTIRVLKDGERASEPFLDISDRLTAGGEQGLLGLAFHPRFERNGRFFVDYTNLDGDTVVSEFAAGDPDSERILLSFDQPFSNHNGGDLAFGPDGHLYIASGDGGSSGDPNDNGQRLDTFLGKMLRIDVDERDGGEYGVPQDNPFAEESSARPEIWSYGLRNPWQFSFDRETGALWIADVGQGAFEEINREARNSGGGLNYGWRVVEGNACFEDQDCERESFVSPVATYSHSFGCAITGGYVYRGETFPDLRGAYITGDYCSGNLWALPIGTERATDPRPALSTDFNISSFGEDEEGEVFLTDHGGGRVVQIIDRD